VTLAGAFVPLLAGAYWARATTQGALLSIVLGLGTWLGATFVAPDSMIPANLLGLFASIVGMSIGSLAPQLLANHGRSLASIRAGEHGHDAGRHGGRDHRRSH
jgi:Na+/proline symporter